MLFIAIYAFAWGRKLLQLATATWRQAGFNNSMAQLDFIKTAL
jgi:hypothetical protein